MTRLFIRTFISVTIMSIVIFIVMIPSASDVSSFATKEPALSQPVMKKLRTTAYSSRHCETDDSPFITSTGDSVSWGTAAFSRDLLHKYGYGTVVYIEEMGLFRVSDTMHRRKRSQIDIWFPKTEDAKRFGIKNLRVYIFPTRQIEWMDQPI